MKLHGDWEAYTLYRNGATYMNVYTEAGGRDRAVQSEAAGGREKEGVTGVG